MAHTFNPKWIHGFGGENAVEIFFVISGFYIALILDRTYANKRTFYLNRFLRLYPMYYIVVLAVLIRSFMIPEFFSQLFNHPTQILAIVNFTNWSLFGTDWVMFMQWHDSGLHFGSYRDSNFPVFHAMYIPQAWSLGIEVTFYLLAPLICKLRTRYIFTIEIILILIKLTAWIEGLNKDPWSYRFFLFELPIFLIGVLLYRLKNRKIWDISISTRKVQVMGLSLYLSFGIISTYILSDRKAQFLVLLIFTCLLILFAEQNHKDTKMGELSYPLYICHLFVISSIDWFVAQLVKFNSGFLFLDKDLVKLPVMLFFFNRIFYASLAPI